MHDNPQRLFILLQYSFLCHFPPSSLLSFLLLVHFLSLDLPLFISPRSEVLAAFYARAGLPRLGHLYEKLEMREIYCDIRKTEKQPQPQVLLKSRQLAKHATNLCHVERSAHRRHRRRPDIQPGFMIYNPVLPERPIYASKHARI
jgi:hypothetical protein